MHDIDVTDCDMIALIKAAYNLSKPQGLGFMHFTPEPLTDEEAKSLICKDGSISLDYIKGRAVKLHTRIRDGRMVMPNRWFDHTDAQQKQLLAAIGKA